MSMPALRPVTTIDELLALPEDGQRHELLDGVHVVSPAPAYLHQKVLMRFTKALLGAVAARDDLQLLASPADIVLGPRTLGAAGPCSSSGLTRPIRPRVGRTLASRWWPSKYLRHPPPHGIAGPSAGSYQRAGVAEYWVVDSDAALIERWMPGDVRPEIVDEVLTWAIDGERLLEQRVEALFSR